MTKFSEELIALQMAMLLCTSAVAAYLLLIRKKKRESAEWVPAALVRAYLDRMQSDERDTRFKLFGEHSPVGGQAYGHMPLTAALTGSIAGGASMDPALLKEVEALRAQLTLADQRTMEFDRMMNALRAEKSALEGKLKEAAANPAAAGAAAAGAAAPSAAALKEMEELKARLQEYEVIEDDLANLKKFQKENEQLKAKVAQLEGGTTVIAADKPAAPTMTVISGGAAPAEPAAPADTNTNVLTPVNPMAEAAPAPAAAAPEKTAQQKEEELLSEFEKMLAS